MDSTTRTVIPLDQITNDPKNLNKGNGKAGQSIIDKSIDAVGWGRSMVMSKDNVVLAGNHALLKAKEDGVEPLIIDSDGSRPVIIRRTDLVSTDQKATQLAILDNVTSQKNMVFDYANAGAVIADAGLTIEECGLTIEEVPMPTTVSEKKGSKQTTIGGDNLGDEGDEGDGDGEDGGESAPSQTKDKKTTKALYGIMIECADEEEQRAVFKALKGSYPNIRLVSV